MTILRFGWTERVLTRVCRGICPELPIPYHPVTRTKMGAFCPLLPGCAKRQKRGDQAEGDLGVARNVTKR